MKNTRNKSNLVNKGLIIAVTVGLVLCGGLLYWFHFKDTSSIKPATQQPAGNSLVNSEPATAAEKNDSEAHKDEIINQQAQQSNVQPNGKRSVAVSVSIDPQNGDGSLEVYAQISGIVEDGGTCTLNATQGTQNFSQKVSSIANASTTNCAQFVIPRSSFTSAGTWNFTVSYLSNNAQGMSTPKSVEIK